MSGSFRGRRPSATVLREADTSRVRGSPQCGRDKQLTGLSLLFGSNADAGGIQMFGTATKRADGTIAFDVNYEWNDLIDPNKRYGIDRIFGTAGNWLGARDYHITIPWKQSAVWEIPRKGQPDRGLTRGWPW